MKWCPKCETHKSRNDFPKDKSRKDGLGGYCKLCIKKWQKENKELLYLIMKRGYDKKREIYINYKKSLSCQQCGENHSVCLEFHHRNQREKDFIVGRSLPGHGIKTIMNEIAKCDVLCANCHRKLHYSLKKK